MVDGCVMTKDEASTFDGARAPVAAPPSGGCCPPTHSDMRSGDTTHVGATGVCVWGDTVEWYRVSRNGRCTTGNVARCHHTHPSSGQLALGTSGTSTERETWQS